ncbi:efflux RND transporter periplasmic adaptor subunit [Pseudorhodobacter sp.]|uniref:efflux RND transporter periplasmic adaptor subunit n=1 Tax=Pseudorhodobacter sp. TaxID=1934400 RepID=UPI002647C840|nr:efflux RND transporter periplasmic adaptor subunit [Pseudorhodobacter sp.]MDN5787654.1 efflux RND transporter periplasmic adaptor subunit [Pseudorhodobacter sp.]
MLRYSLCALAVFAIPGPGRADATEFLVEATTIPEMKAVFGQVESRIVVPARARIGGTIRQLEISQGDEVTQGDVIAVVVDDKIALQLNAAEAKIKALNSQLENSRIQLERARQLRTSGVGTQANLDQENMLFIVATNEVAAAEAEKAVIAQNAREGTVFAPASGRVLTVPVTPGSVIMPGEEIGRIAPGPYYLRLSLPERHAAEIVQGADVVVGERGLAQLVDETPQSHRGKIVKVYPEIIDGRVIADVEVDGIGNYFVNERALVSIPVGKRRVLAVPPEGIRAIHGIDYIRIALDGRILDVAVILGEVFEIDGAARVEVLTGLQGGDRVVLP